MSSKTPLSRIKNTLSLFLPAFLFVCGACTLCPAQDLVSPGGGKDVQPAESYEALAAKYVDINEAIADEKRAWKESGAFMARESNLLEKEKSLLAEQIAELEKQIAAGEEDRLGLLRREKESRKLVEEYSLAAQQAAEKLHNWKAILPASLAAPVCDPFFARLGRLKKLTPPEQVELVTALYLEIANITNSVSLTREVLIDGAGVKQEYSVLYLGLAAAYAVSDDGRRAACGYPSGDGTTWEWTWDNNLSGLIRRAVSLYRHETKAAFIELPLKTLSPPETTQREDANE